MHFHINVGIQLAFVLIDCTIRRHHYLRMIVHKADPVEGISVGIVDLIEQVEEIELFEIFGGEELLLLRRFEKREVESFEYLFFE